MASAIKTVQQHSAYPNLKQLEEHLYLNVLVLKTDDKEVAKNAAELLLKIYKAAKVLPPVGTLISSLNQDRSYTIVNYGYLVFEEGDVIVSAGIEVS